MVENFCSSERAGTFRFWSPGVGSESSDLCWLLSAVCLRISWSLIAGRACTGKEEEKNLEARELSAGRARAKTRTVTKAKRKRRHANGQVVAVRYTLPARSSYNQQRRVFDKGIQSASHLTLYRNVIIAYRLWFCFVGKI